MIHSAETSEVRRITKKQKKCLDLDTFLDITISFSHLEKKIPF